MIAGTTGITPVVGQILDFKSVHDLKLNKSEVSEAFVVPISTLSDPAVYGHTQFRVPGHRSGGYTLPVYRIPEHHNIWGLTAVITYQFLKALLPPKFYKHKLVFQPRVDYV